MTENPSIQERRLTQYPIAGDVSKALGDKEREKITLSSDEDGLSGIGIPADVMRAMQEDIAKRRGIPVDQVIIKADFYVDEASVTTTPFDAAINKLPNGFPNRPEPTRQPREEKEPSRDGRNPDMTAAAIDALRNPATPPTDTPPSPEPQPNNEPTTPPAEIPRPTPEPTPLPSWLNANPEPTTPNGNYGRDTITTPPRPEPTPTVTIPDTDTNTNTNTTPPLPRPTETPDFPTKVPPSETPTSTPESAWTNTDTTPTPRPEPTVTIAPTETRPPWLDTAPPSPRPTQTPDFPTPPNGSGSEPTSPNGSYGRDTGPTWPRPEPTPTVTRTDTNTDTSPEAPPATTSLDIDYTPPADTQPPTPENKGPIPLVIPLKDGEPATPAEIEEVKKEIEEVQDSGEKPLTKFFKGIKVAWKKFGRKIGCIGLVAIMGACAYNMSPPDVSKAINRNNSPAVADAGPQFGPPEPPKPESIDLSTSADTSAINSTVDRPNRPNIVPTTETPPAAVEDTSMTQELAIMKLLPGANIDSTMRSGVDQQFRNRSDVSEQTKASITELLKEMNLAVLGLTEDEATRMQPNDTVYYSNKLADAFAAYYAGDQSWPGVAKIVLNDQQGVSSSDDQWEAAFDDADERYRVLSSQPRTNQQ